MELSPASGGAAAAEALSWPEMFPALESDSPLPPRSWTRRCRVSGAVAGGMLDRILLESVCQQQSWDVKGPPTHRLSCGQSPYTETTTWQRKYCILTDSQLVLLNKEKEIPVEGGQEQQADSTKGRCLRRTVSVPSEGQFPEYPPEGATKLGKIWFGFIGCVFCLFALLAAFCLFLCFLNGTLGQN
uniref:Uncharacterized protein n=1 Tax=Oryctolagus cuniculus TaxID=9986 RepID=A0A5F9CSG6_RABIT